MGKAKFHEDPRIAAEFHGDTVGRRVYDERRHDVEVCGEPEIWCWPFGDADEAYIAQVGITALCSEAGFSIACWDAAKSLWRKGFNRGYHAAHEMWLEAKARS